MTEWLKCIEQLDYRSHQFTSNIHKILPENSVPLQLEKPPLQQSDLRGRTYNTIPSGVVIGYDISQGHIIYTAIPQRPKFRIMPVYLHIYKLSDFSQYIIHYRQYTGMLQPFRTNLQLSKNAISKFIPFWSKLFIKYGKTSHKDHLNIQTPNLDWFSSFTLPHNTTTLLQKTISLQKGVLTTKVLLYYTVITTYC